MISYNQNVDLIGKNGLTPANKYMELIHHKLLDRPAVADVSFSSLSDNFKLFLNVPTIFWFLDWYNQIDELLIYTSVSGLLISGFIFLTGSANSLMMFILWLLYHSIVNVGQTWYSFGWESQLLETGFITMFLVPLFSLNMMNAKSPPSFIAIHLYIFRIMIGAVIKKSRVKQVFRNIMISKE